MTFWGALLALAWDQVAPLFRPGQQERLYGRLADWLFRYVNAGSQGHGLLAWGLGALAPAMVAALLGHWLEALAWPLGLAWTAALLYRCLGLRQVVDLARGLAEAGRAGDTARMLDRLDQLGGRPADGDDRPDVLAQLAVDRIARLALGRLFGVLFWFVVLGLFGALAYAMTRLLAERWQGDDDFQAAVNQAASLLDWLPARTLAVSFALVGNFEEAMLAWRSRESEGDPYNEGVVRAAGLGALGVDAEHIDADTLAGLASLLNRVTLLWLGGLGLLWLGGL